MQNGLRRSVPVLLAATVPAAGPRRSGLPVGGIAWNGRNSAIEAPGRPNPGRLIYA